MEIPRINPHSHPMCLLNLRPQEDTIRLSSQKSEQKLSKKIYVFITLSLDKTTTTTTTTTPKPTTTTTPKPTTTTTPAPDIVNYGISPLRKRFFFSFIMVDG